MEPLNPEPSLLSVKAILILDNDGKRLVCKYYDDTFPTLKEQTKFEESLFNKTKRSNDEIIMHEGVTAVYKVNVDLFFAVLGAQNENELMLVGVLNALYDSISQLLRKNVEKRSLLPHLESLFLIVDELVECGVIVETDPQVIVQRIATKIDDNPFSESAMKQVLQSAKENIKWSLLK
ncbi:coatomer subunit zeta-1-like [Halichondria panicea]|uniref:coatomer subunit zeta-1-like n=1 Tax=Halichondria panicea TaxID=6063 RepID=UPI00312B9B9A